MKYGFLNAVFLVILLLLLYFHIDQADKILPHPTYGDYKLGFFLPIIALFFNIFANFFIKRDEDAVRSANRFRS
jgi:Co/Zn/Cd efflux system component